MATYAKALDLKLVSLATLPMSQWQNIASPLSISSGLSSTHRYCRAWFYPFFAALRMAAKSRNFIHRMRQKIRAELAF